MAKKFGIRELGLLFLLSLGIILLFALLDYLAHSLSIDYSVPPRYFYNKIIYGTLIGFIALLVLRKQKPFVKSLVFSSVVSVLLQVRYFIEGYPLSFVLVFLVVHFLILFAISFALFKLVKKYNISI